jgi:rRNA maturation endonuclease Nob1
MATEPGDIDDLKGAFDDYKKLLPTVENLVNNVSSLYDQINAVNKAFGEGRLRATEFSTAISDSVSGVIRVGGEVNEISQTIIDIAAGARRNIVATTETIVELTAASKALGDFNIENITESFLRVGIAIADIGENIEESILYVQSIGLNTESVMSEVVRNM